MATTGRGRGARAVNKLKKMSNEEVMARRTKAAQAKAKAAKKKTQPTLKSEYRKDAAAAKSGNTKRNMSSDAVMGRRAKAAQAGAKKTATAVRPKANAPMKKETVAPRKKPVNAGNVSKPKRGQRAATSAAKKKVSKKVTQNVLRDSSGKSVKSGSGKAVRTLDYDNMTQAEIDRLFY